MSNEHSRQRYLLSVIAANGILEHNTAVEMPKAYSARGITNLLPDHDHSELEYDLAKLTDDGLLRKWNTSHSGYGNSWVEGHDTWRITPLGLIHLWKAL
jgi:hypothetical protein